MTFNIKLCGVVIQICHRYEYIKKLCRDYLSDSTALFCASVTEKQLDAEMKLTEGRFSKEVCESTCLHREIVKGLVKYGIILIHSAAIAVDGEAYVFLAKSGVGKSTHIRLWKELFGERAVIVNGDKPMFSFVGDSLTVHGSPWRGKEHWGENVSLPVKAICFLERSVVNEIARATETEAVEKLFHQVLLPIDAQDMAMFMELLNRIVKDVPLYRLRCNMEQEAALVSYEGMRKEETT